MKKQFVPPIKINKKPAKTFYWSDGCPRTTESINPIYRIARNHYQDLYELYKKLYNIGYVCTSQEPAITQILRYPAQAIVFVCFRFHVFKPSLYWFSFRDIGSEDKIYHSKFRSKVNRSLDSAFKIVKQFTNKFDRYGRKIVNMDDKLNQAIKNANRAEKAAKKAKQLVQQYKEKQYEDEKKYVVIVAYDNLWTTSPGCSMDDSCNFLVATEHSAGINDFSLDYVSKNDLEEKSTFGLSYWLTKGEAKRVAKKIGGSFYNTNNPAIMSKHEFEFAYTTGEF